MKVLRVLAVTLVMLAGQFRLAQADPVRNGNELALNLVRFDSEQRAQLVKQRLNMLHAFRFLTIKEKSAPNPDTGAITLKTVEPSSDATIIFTVNTQLSLDIVRTLTTNDALAVNGRVLKISNGNPPTMHLGQVVVQFRGKDKDKPKLGRELLNEVDSKAH